MSSQTDQKTWARPSRSQSRSMSQYIASAIDISNYSDEELVGQVEKLKINNRLLAIENEILENTIKRIDPSLMNGIQQAFEIALWRSKRRSTVSLGRTSKHSDSLSRSAIASVVKFTTTSNRTDASVIFGTSPKLNINERSELVTRETQILMDKIIDIRKASEKRHSLFKARLEQITMRNDAVEKAIVSFNQQVVIEGWDKITKRIPAEAWLRYMNDWNSLADKEIHKLRLRTSANFTQLNKLNSQLATKSKLSHKLTPIDFEKINAEIKIQLKVLDKKQAQCKILKKLLGDANLNLAVHRKALVDQDTYLTKVRKEIRYRREHTSQLMSKTTATEKQAEMWESALHDVKKATDSYKSPDLLRYIGLKDEIANLTRSNKLLEHKLSMYQNLSRTVESIHEI